MENDASTAARPAWRWPWYFTCWNCAQPHTECRCGTYECPTHEECIEAARGDRRSAS